MSQLNIVCLSCYFKGAEYLVASKNAGHRVFLVTSESLKNHPWPRESVDEFFYMPEAAKNVWNMNDLVSGIAGVFQNTRIDKIVALDDFDVERAAHLREHFRIPGMGETTSRYFRDKLAMRMQARDNGLAHPAFSSLFNNEDINHYIQDVDAPWVVKPRSQASATGITKVFSAEELWDHLNHLGNERHKFVLEQFRPGDVYHVDGLAVEGEVVFTQVSRYLDTPMSVAHEGGIFRSASVEYGSDDQKTLIGFNKEVMKAFGMKSGSFHSEYIKDKQTGDFLFLETSSRVGGAHLSDMVQAASGINLWTEWARIETSIARKEEYVLPTPEHNYAGIVVSLSRFQHPDTSSFTDQEITWRMTKDHHIGFVLKSDRPDRVRELLDQYTDRIANEFHASAPAPDTPAG